MSGLIFGSSILSQKLIKNGNPECLKHSTYDLTIGRIYPTGENSASISEDTIYFLEPRQAVLVLSEEEFGLPATVTGLATLRTTLTKSGLLALNVGIIDPKFNGPISTTLINFSDQKVAIKRGMPFFRVLFFEHGDTNAYHRNNESKVYRAYEDELRELAFVRFPRSFMNLPKFDNSFYAGTALKMIKGLSFKYWYFSIPSVIFALSTLVFIVQNKNYQTFIGSTFETLKKFVPFL
jgi:deoxycytidine triphosphate deaminase